MEFHGSTEAALKFFKAHSHIQCPSQTSVLLFFIANLTNVEFQIMGFLSWLYRIKIL